MKKSDYLDQVVRGPITWSDFTALRYRMEQKWKPFQYSKELVLLLDSSDDVRIKINSFDCKVIYKNNGNGKSTHKAITIQHAEIIHIIELLDILKAQDWIVSFDEKYEVSCNNYDLTFRFNTHIGDFFEIKPKNHNFSQNNQNEINSILTEFELKPWDNESFKILNKKAWDEVRSTHAFSEGKLHVTIKEFIEHVKSLKNPETIMSRLQKLDNYYSKKEYEFEKNLNSPLLSKEPLTKDNTFNKTVSIVIPAYNCMSSLPFTLESLKNQDLTDKEWSQIEIIVVDDGSTDKTEQFVQSFKGIPNLIYVKQNNMGMACSGNTGVTFSKGEIIIFVDADIVLEKNFIREHAVRHSVLDDVVLISFVENISAEELTIRLNSKERPNIYSDFRFSKNIHDSNLQMYRYIRDLDLREVKIVDETENLKRFGNAKVLEIWDLPSMVITSALSFKKKDYKSVGGMSMQFKGWGMEDAFFGASLIALGNYIVPVFSTGVFHIDHPPRSGSKKTKMEEFRRNASTYLELVNAPIETVIKNSNYKRK